MKLLYLKPHFIDFTVCIELLETLRVPTARKIYLFFEKTFFASISDHGTLRRSHLLPFTEILS